jgi:hypothetical protein
VTRARELEIDVGTGPLDALPAAETMTGRGGVTAYGLEPELLLEAVRRNG